jgi:hypothetical protein
MRCLRLDLLILLSMPSVVVVAADLAVAPGIAPNAPAIGAVAADPAGATASSSLVDDEPHYPDLPVLFIMDWNYSGAKAALRRLEEVGGTFERLREQGWTIGLQATDQLRIVSRDQVPELVERLDLRVFPAVVAVHGDEVVRSFRSGCTTPLDEYTFQWMRTGVSSRPAEAPGEPVTVEWSGRYPLRGAHWSVEGTYSPNRQLLLRHLRGGNHQHLIPADWEIESWSYEELRSLHDDLHEMNRPRDLVSTSDAAGSPQPAARTVQRYDHRYQPKQTLSP